MVARRVRQFIISQAVAAIMTTATSITATTIHSSGQVMAHRHSKAPQKRIGMFAAALACRAYRECRKT
jgi:hypothetical protein